MTTRTDEKDGTIIPFKTLPPPPERPTPSEIMIDALTELLEAAKAGTLQGMTYVGADNTGKCRWGMVGRVGGFAMAGAMATAMHELNEINLDDTADTDFEP